MVERPGILGLYVYLRRFHNLTFDRDQGDGFGAVSGQSGYGNPSREAAVIEDRDDVIVGRMLVSVND